MAEWLTMFVVVTLGLGLAGLLLFVLAACVQSGNDAEDEQRWIETMMAAGWQEWPAAANSNNQADRTEHDDG